MNLIERSKAHVDAVGESYGAHGRFAFAVGWALVVAGLACILHALVPAWFPDKASRTVATLQAVFADRSRAPVLLGGDRERAPIGLIALLSLGNAATPWLAGATPLVALPLSALSLGLLLAVAVAPAGEEPVLAAA